MRTIKVGLLATLAAVVAVVAAPGALADVRGPACADIVGGAFTYEEGIVSGSMTLAAPACRQVSYTLHVIHQESGVTKTTSLEGTLNPAAPNRVFFNGAVADDDGTVCVYATSSIGRHVFDRAPDEGCVEVSEGAPGQSGFN